MSAKSDKVVWVEICLEVPTAEKLQDSGLAQMLICVEASFSYDHKRSRVIWSIRGIYEESPHTTRWHHLKTTANERA